MPAGVRRLLVALCLVAGVVPAMLASSRPGRDVRTDDQNHDGRPDVWRAYDRLGRLASVAFDTNFDGRSDIQEYYEQGALVRRESDRDFNDRVDLIQEFDATTSESTRSVVDVDFDGSADLLVLFQQGRPVFLKWADKAVRTASVTTPRNSADQLIPLDDPFLRDLALRGVRVTNDANDGLELSVACGVPSQPTGLSDPLAGSAPVVAPDSVSPRACFLARAQRGPPRAI